MVWLLSVLQDLSTGVAVGYIVLKRTLGGGSGTWYHILSSPGACGSLHALFLGKSIENPMPAHREKGLFNSGCQRDVLCLSGEKLKSLNFIFKKYILLTFL